jgi:N-acetylmuramoyl-L-alanine amidase
MSESNHAQLPWLGDPVAVLARTIYGENRDHGTEGMQSVANVVMNRVASGITWWGHDVLSVCLKPEQFSVWNPLTKPALFPPDSDYEATVSASETDPDYVQCLQVARQAIAGTLPDITGGATSYIDESLPQPWPSWASASAETTRVGGQVFYKVV